MSGTQSFRRLAGNWSYRRVGMLALTTLGVTLAISVGLGVGLSHQSEGQHQMKARAICTAPPSTLNPPLPGASWNYVLKNPVPSPSSIDTSISVWAIDLEDNDASTIATMKKKGVNVVCYFSAGSYEDWRSDASSFKPEDLGKDLDGWEGEKWLNIRSQNVRKIMTTRLDKAVEKGCDGVDPDNVDGYDNENGLNLQPADSIDYVSFLANESHKRNLAVSLKNAGAIIPDVIDCVDFSVNEQCVQYKECDTYADFIQSGKAVLHVEYPKGEDVNNDKAVDKKTADAICKDPTATGFSTILKNMNLDNWIQKC